ncbi:MAG: DUF2399 domain-containing protein [Firmicutes bacterium]|nr:DUF2399 domain-containing protein [Bacillota bacterium]
MRRYDEEILNALLDSLERRKDYTASQAETTGRRVCYRIDRRHLPAYFDTSSLAWQTVHEQMEALQQKGLIELHWKDGQSGHILEKVSLVREQAAAAYAFLGRTPKAEQEQRILKNCRKLRPGSTPVLGAFLDWIVQRLERHESIRQFAQPEDPDGFDRLCRMIGGMERSTEDRYLREFSIEVFRDSKTAEQELPKAAAVFRRFAADAYGRLTADEILEEHGIYRTPVWVYVKGRGQLRIGDGVRVDLQELREGIGIAGADLDVVRWDASEPPEQVLTIENLTSFHRWTEGDSTLAVYLGGFAGRRRQQLLKGIHKAFPLVRYRHFGDIDCGGFRIWRSLCEHTGISFEPYRMDLATWEAYRESGRPLTAGDRTALQQMLADPYYEAQHELFSRMLEEGIKLEQESIV